MVRRLLLRAEAADSRCTRSSAADEALTKGFSAERPALICSMSARQFLSTVSASSLGTIAPPQQSPRGINQRSLNKKPELKGASGTLKQLNGARSCSSAPNICFSKPRPHEPIDHGKPTQRAGAGLGCRGSATPSTPSARPIETEQVAAFSALGSAVSLNPIRARPVLLASETPDAALAKENDNDTLTTLHCNDPRADCIRQRTRSDQLFWQRGRRSSHHRIYVRSHDREG
jgi:hypothetical protein